MRYERGISLSQMMVWGFILIVLVMIATKVAPTVIEYYKTLSATKSVVRNASPQATVAELRTAYSKYAEVEHLKSVKPTDLDISKDAGQTVIAFSISEKIPLFGPASLVLDFQGSTNEQ